MLHNWNHIVCCFLRLAFSVSIIPLRSVEVAACINSVFLSFILIFSCVKFQESNDKTQLIFGSITNIPAKDAAPVEVNIGTFFEKMKVIVFHDLHRFENKIFVFFLEDRHHAGPGRQWKPGAVHRSGSGK